MTVFHHIVTVQELVQAILEANSTPGSHKIELGRDILLSAPYESTLNGLPGVTPTAQNSITIVGNGWSIRRDPAASPFRILYVGGAGNVELQGLTIQGGKLTGDNNSGGGIYNTGHLTITQGCHIRDNEVEGANSWGGGIVSQPGATLNISSSVFSNNRGDRGGALMYSDVHSASITDCIFEGNCANEAGGAIQTYLSNLNVTGCLMVGNISLVNGGAIQIHASEITVSDSTFTENSAQNGASFYQQESVPHRDDITINHCRIFGNLGETSVFNSTTEPDIDATCNWWGANDGPGREGPGQGDAISLKVEYAPFLETDTPHHEGRSFCPFCHAADDDEQSDNPISLRKGEKRLQVTDLFINSPSGPLAFTRYYRQHQQKNSYFRFMGAGWTHNHYASLVIDSSSAEIFLPNGSVLKLKGTGDRFTGQPGSNATLEYDSLNSEGRLIAPDGSQYVFEAGENSVFRLRQRNWPNGESWSYSYYPDSNDLAEVDDGYARKLVFRYRTVGPNFVGLYRVGDHSFDDSDPDNPIGRYVEFDYIAEKVLDANDQVVDGEGYLLASVTDVRNRNWKWTYQYHQEDGPGATICQLNYLIARNFSDSSDPENPTLVTLEELTYDLQHEELAVNGGMEEASGGWTDLNATSVRSDVQKAEGNWSRYVVTNAFAGGIQSVSPWNLVAGRTYILSAQVWPVNNPVTMQISSLPSISRETVGLGAWETLRIVYTPETDITSVRLQVLGLEPQDEFYVDVVSIVETERTLVGITQNRGGELITHFTFNGSDPEGQESTIETITDQQLQTIHYFEHGVYAGVEDPLHHRLKRFANTQYRPTRQEDAYGHDTWLKWDSTGKQLQQVTDPLGHATKFQYQDELLNYSLDAQGRKTEYLYGDGTNPRLPTDIKVIDSDSSAVLWWQKFSYDSHGRPLTEQTLDPINGTTVLQQVTRTYYADTPGLDGAGLLESVTPEDIGGYSSTTTYYTYDSLGRVIKTRNTSLLGACQASYTVYDEAGNVLATLCNFDPGTVNPLDPTTVSQAQILRQRLYNANDPDHYTDPDTNRLTLYEYDPLGRRVKTTLNAGDAYQQVNLTLYDTLGRVLRTITNYQPQGTSAPGDWVWDVANSLWKQSSNGPAISHGSALNENLISDTDYNDRGQVRLRRDVLGNETLYGYDAAGRVVKTVQNASDQGYNNDYSGSTPDPDLSDYIATTTPDEDLISTSEYDAVGNLVKTVSPSGDITFMVYDALNRVVKTVRNAKDAATISLNSGDAGYDAANDPRSDDYEPSDEPDRDHLEITEYDPMGRVVQTQRLVETRGGAVWSMTYQVYDNLDRPIRSIANYVPQGETDPANWEWANNRWEDGANNPIDHGDNDRNLITETVYDSAGRVQYTLDVQRRKTWRVYDGLGRQVKTIVNYIPQGSSDPADWEWNAGDGRWEDGTGQAIAYGAGFDQNIISSTSYDSDGRVQSTRDVDGKLTWHVYDDAGRQVKAIANHLAQGSSDPSDWEWDEVTGHWEDGANNAIDRGPNADRNLITETVYDDQGRVLHIRDMRGNLTHHVYDSAGRQIAAIANYVPQGSSNPVDWIWDAGDGRWEDGAGNPISHGTENNQNLISVTVFDVAGRVVSMRDVAGMETRHCYDRLGRRTRTVVNYMAQGASDPANWIWDEDALRWEDGSENPISHGAAFDQNLLSDTTYNQAGQVVSTRDVRGTQTEFVYDLVGRRVQVIQAAGTPLATIAYTCYDKSGRVLRILENWADMGVSPDTQDASGNWEFVPEHNGAANDENCVVAYTYDAAGRRTSVTDPVGNVTVTSYRMDGQVDTVTDPMDVVSLYRYDGLGRRTLVVQGYIPNGEDAVAWAWDTGQGRWEQSDGTAIVHGADNDQNVIVQATYDLAGRMASRRDPRGNVTHYSYDEMGRRTALTDPLDHTWQTSYSDQGSGSRVRLTDPMGYETQRDFDRAGRLSAIAYLNESPKLTPDVSFDYDVRGNRLLMSESNGTGTVRQTGYQYNHARHLTQVDFDTNGDEVTEETVSYTYDVGGLRTQLTLPGNLSVIYTYDRKGRLISLTDWDGHQTRFAYDNAGRMVETQRANGLRSRYGYDAGGHLRLLQHGKDHCTVARFAYEVDGRGNRIQAQELLAHPATLDDTTYLYDDRSIVYRGSWTNAAPYKVSTQHSASLQLMFFGQEANLLVGTGSDHGIFDVYVDYGLWRSFDGYAATSGEMEILLAAEGTGPHLLEIRNRAEKHLDSSGYRLRFKQMVVPNGIYDLHTIQYRYDALSRLTEARYHPGMNTSVGDADLLRRYQYSYDLAGNRLSESVAVNGGTPTVTSYSYNAANQITNTGFAYDYNSNLTSDGVNTYTWDRANRLTSMGGISYAYDGMGNRINQTTNSIVTDYLLDVQPGLVKVLAATAGADSTRFVHGPRGILAHEDNMNSWSWMVQDGLGSVRSVLDGMLGVDSMQSYTPIGVPLESDGLGTPFGFTGEMTDANDLLYLRARYYNPALGVFTALDPVETGNRYQYVGGNPTNDAVGEPMSLNRYSYVAGNPTNFVDPSGMIMESDPNTCVHLSPRRQGGRLAECEEKCDHLRPKTILQQIFLGWKPFHQCVDVCLLEPMIPRRHTFADTEYPLSCDLFPNAESCMSTHLWFLLNTETMRYLHGRESLSPDDIALFVSFVAPDPLWYEYHSNGTPADVKSHYERYQEETNEGKCITLYGMRYGRDVPGNIIFGYLARYAGFRPLDAAAGAGLAQFLDDLRTGSETSSVDLGEDFGDSPEDQAAIIMGMALFEICGGFSCSHDEFRAVLEAYRNEYVEATAISNRAECRPSS